MNNSYRIKKYNIESESDDEDMNFDYIQETINKSKEIRRKSKESINKLKEFNNRDLYEYGCDYDSDYECDNLHILYDKKIEEPNSVENMKRNKCIKNNIKILKKAYKIAMRHKPIFVEYFIIILVKKQIQYVEFHVMNVIQY